jgi:hypothetical protein
MQLRRWLTAVVVALVLASTPVFAQTFTAQIQQFWNLLRTGSIKFSSIAAGNGVPDAAHPISLVYSSNSDIQMIFQNLNTGSSAAAEFDIKADTSRLNISVEGINSSDAFGAQRAQIYAATGGGGATSHTSGIDIISCEAATPTLCFTRFVTNGLNTGAVRATMDVNGLTMNNSATSLIGFAAGVGAADVGLSRSAAAAMVLGNGTVGDFTGTLKLGTVNAVTAYQTNGTPGATHAACSVSVTAITVTNGLVTAITCT